MGNKSTNANAQFVGQEQIKLTVYATLDVISKFKEYKQIQMDSYLNIKAQQKITKLNNLLTPIVK